MITIDSSKLPKPPTYRELRAAAYAPIPAQLDMQYKDKLNNTTTWVDHITKVKTDIPKESKQ